MSTTDPPSYLEQGTGVKVYHLHTPFNPHVPQEPQQAPQQAAVEKPRFTAPEQMQGSHLEAETGKKNYVKYDVGLGRSPGMTNCSTCHKDVETVVTYKAGTYAWLMCLLFICCGLVLCCCLIPFFMNSFKDAHHSCPYCHKVLHIEKKKCCE
ncbi:cell death-inducing p53-target protein 1 homolog [Oryzias melastigma]|uniref:Si:ch211-157c3.4 n=1 Tax=Oryzias melastigma TaxID=30732 RepID=A0A3B3CQG6_ORYME|nr:cell death-inducing p53-target protein 1 homolog [Oryzias melastigma]